VVSGDRSKLTTGLPVPDHATVALRVSSDPEMFVYGTAEATGLVQRRLEGFNGLSRAEIEATLSASEGMADLPKDSNMASPEEVARRQRRESNAAEPPTPRAPSDLRERVAEAIGRVVPEAGRAVYEAADAAIAAMQVEHGERMAEKEAIYNDAYQAGYSAAGGGRADKWQCSKCLRWNALTEDDCYICGRVSPRPVDGEGERPQSGWFKKERAELLAENERLRELQAGIDKAYGALSSSQYVGGPSQREAWRIAAEALGPLATEHTAQGAGSTSPEGEG
jgi:hypothetical protein